MDVKGFPTLKIVKPSKKPGGAPLVEDYQGARTARAISDAILDRMPNHVTRIKDDGLDTWVASRDGVAKALFFSEKSSVSATLKALAVDFLGGIDFAQVRSSDKSAATRYGITSYPALVLLPTNGADPVKFDGLMKKAPLLEFLSQVQAPNPDPPAQKSKKSTASKSKRMSASKTMTVKPAAASETLEADADPIESPEPNVAGDSPKPVDLPVRRVSTITSLDTPDALQKSCLHKKATTCILALLPASGPQSQEMAEDTKTMPIEILNLGDIAHKHAQRGAKMFPFYSVAASNAGAVSLADALNVDRDADAVRIMAVNAKRNWWTLFAGEDVSGQAIERWIDRIRFDEIIKDKLPEGLVVELEEELPKAQPATFTVLGDDGNESPIQVEILEMDDDENGHDEL